MTWIRSNKEISYQRDLSSLNFAPSQAAKFFARDECDIIQLEQKRNEYHIGVDVEQDA